MHSHHASFFFNLEEIRLLQTLQLHPRMAQLRQKPVYRLSVITLFQCRHENIVRLCHLLRRGRSDKILCGAVARRVADIPQCGKQSVVFHNINSLVNNKKIPGHECPGKIIIPCHSLCARGLTEIVTRRRRPLFTTEISAFLQPHGCEFTLDGWNTLVVAAAHHVKKSDKSGLPVLPGPLFPVKLNILYES